MATADELARTEAPAFDFQMRFYVSGPRAWVSTANIIAGGAYDPSPSTETTAGVDATSTEIPVDSTAGFTTGAIVIAPTDEYEEYEVISYGSKDADSFNELTRAFGEGLDAGFHHGVHAAGAAVSEWAEITGWVHTLELGLEEADAIATWRAELTGTGYNSRLMAQDNALLGMWRFRPANGDLSLWTDWSVAFIGYIKTADVDDSHKQEKAWRLDVQGVAQYLAASDAPAHHFGQTDLAAGKSVRVSGVLHDPYLERGSGEYVGYPSLEGDNLVDGDLGTVWISDDVPTVTKEQRFANRFVINEVYLQAPPGQPDLQWLELFYKNQDGETEGDLKYYHVVNGGTEFNWVDEKHEFPAPVANYINLDKKGRPMDPDGGFAIICSNRPRFEERWGVGGALHVLDWRDFQIGTWTVNPAGGFLAWFYQNGAVESIVWWGTAVPQKFGARGEFDGYGPGWTGATIPTPPAGHSFRRNPCGAKGSPDSAASFLADESNPTPGEAGDDTPEYFSVDLGALGIELVAELAADEEDEMELNTTLGLLPAGTVMVNDEGITYTSRDDDNDKLLGLTRGVVDDPAVHPIGSSVIPYEGGLAVDAHLVRRVQWKRRPVMSGGTLVSPRTFRILFSVSENPIYPDDPAWDDDWKSFWTETSQIYVANLPPSIEWSAVPPGGTARARHVLMIIRSMWGNGRAAMNEFHAYAATGEVVDGDGAAAGTTETPYSGEVVKYLLVNNFGLSSDQVTLTDQGTQFGKLPTTKARYLQVIRDLCKKTGCSVYFGLDETVEHRYNPMFPLRGLDSAETTWDRDNARSVELSAPNMHNISQVILRARNEQEDLMYEVRYPPKPLGLGSELVVEDVALGSVTEALLMAEQIFRRRNGPLSVTVTPVGPAEWVRPGQRHLVTWPLDTQLTLLQGRNFVVTRVQYDIDFGLATATQWRQKKWGCTIGLQELIF
ncbi:MAG: hypothetical protein WC977_10680 [Anaerovoracaceae bacterium]